MRMIKLQSIILLNGTNDQEVVYWERVLRE